MDGYYQVRLDHPIRWNLPIGIFRRSGYIVPRNLPIRMILQLNNRYLPSEKFTSCDMGTPFRDTFLKQRFFLLWISIPFGV